MSNPYGSQYNPRSVSNSSGEYGDVFRHQFDLKGTIVIVISFVIALMLMVIPLPSWAVWWRPEWVLLALIYWTMTVPHRVSVGVAFILGLVIDVLTGHILGQHALALTIVIYFVAKFDHQLRVLPHWQQNIAVLILIAFYQLLNLWLQVWLYQTPMTLQYWLATLTSTLFWPWVFILLRDFRLRFNVV